MFGLAGNSILYEFSVLFFRWTAVRMVNGRVISIRLLKLFIFLSFAAFSGCGPRLPEVREPDEPKPEIRLGTTIGELVEVRSARPIPVEGFGMVGQLKGTGSVGCPLRIRNYLEQYILKQPTKGKLNPTRFISSEDTAVVLIRGVIPAFASRNDFFDVFVTALPDSQTTSLKGGRLYAAELKPAGAFGLTLGNLAIAEGPVFIDPLDDEAGLTNGYVLAGATVLRDCQIGLSLRRPDYLTAALIRNRINERFGKDIAEAASPSQIQINIPRRYERRKMRFISLITSTYLTQSPAINKERLNRAIARLSASEDPQRSEILLEAIGKEALSKLEPLLHSSQEQVRFRAARCMLGLGSDEGLDVLRVIATDSNSKFRVEALQAIRERALKNDAAAVCRSLLRDSEFEVRVAAYKQLLMLDDVSVRSELIGRNFFLDQILSTPHRSVYVTRTGQPRIAIFGGPILCRQDIFIDSDDKKITLNATADSKQLTIMWTTPDPKSTIVSLESSFRLSDIIRTLGEEPTRKKGKWQQGLNVSYSEIIALLKKMYDKGAVDAEFRAGELPEIGRFVKSNLPVGR